MLSTKLLLDYIISLLVGAATPPTAEPQSHMGQRTGGQFGFDPTRAQIVRSDRQSNMFRRPGRPYLYHVGDDGEPWALGDDPRRRRRALDRGGASAPPIIPRGQPIVVDELPAGDRPHHSRFVDEFDPGVPGFVGEYEYLFLSDLNTAIDPEHNWYSLHGDIDKQLEWFFGLYQIVFGIPVANGVGVGPNFAYPYSAERVNGEVRFYGLELPNLIEAQPGDFWRYPNIDATDRLGDIPILESGGLVVFMHQVAAFLWWASDVGRHLHGVFFDGYAAGKDAEPGFYETWYKDSVPTPASLGSKAANTATPVEAITNHELKRYRVTGTGGGYTEIRESAGTAKARRYTYPALSGASVSQLFDRWQTFYNPVSEENEDSLPTNDYTQIFRIHKNGNGEVVCGYIDNHEDQGQFPSGSLWATGEYEVGALKACVDLYFTFRHDISEYTVVIDQGFGYHVEQTWAAAYYDALVPGNVAVSNGRTHHQTGLLYTGLTAEDPWEWTFNPGSSGRNAEALRNMRSVAKPYVIDPRDSGGGAMSVADLQRWWIMDYTLAQLVPYTTTLIDPAAWNGALFNLPELGVDLEWCAGLAVFVQHTRLLTGVPTVPTLGTFDVSTSNAGIRPATVSPGIHRISHQETIACNDGVTRTRGRIRTWYDDPATIESWYPMISSTPNDIRTVVNPAGPVIDVFWPDDQSAQTTETLEFWTNTGAMLVDSVRGNIPRPGGMDTFMGVAIDDSNLDGFSADVIDAPGGEFAVVVTPTEWIVSEPDGVGGRQIAFQGTWAEMLHPELWSFVSGLAAWQKLPIPHYQFLHPDWPFRWGLIQLGDVSLYVRPITVEDRREFTPTDSSSRESPVVVVRSVV